MEKSNYNLEKKVNSFVTPLGLLQDLDLELEDIRSSRAMLGLITMKMKPKTMYLSVKAMRPGTGHVS